MVGGPFWSIDRVFTKYEEWSDNKTTLDRRFCGDDIGRVGVQLSVDIEAILDD